MIITNEREVESMEEEFFNPCENCPYDDDGWCSCENILPDDALCMEEYEDY